MRFPDFLELIAGLVPFPPSVLGAFVVLGVIACFDQISDHVFDAVSDFEFFENVLRGQVEELPLEHLPGRRIESQAHAPHLDPVPKTYSKAIKLRHFCGKPRPDLCVLRVVEHRTDGFRDEMVIVEIQHGSLDVSDGDINSRSPAVRKELLLAFRVDAQNARAVHFSNEVPNVQVRRAGLGVVERMVS